MGPAAHYFRFDSHFASGPAQNIIFPNWFAGRALHGQTVFAKVRSSRALARMAAFSAAPVCIRVRSSRPFGCNRYIGSPQAAACGEKTLLLTTFRKPRWVLPDLRANCFIVSESTGARPSSFWPAWAEPNRYIRSLIT